MGDEALSLGGWFLEGPGGRGHSLATLLPPSRVAARPPPLLVAGSLPGLQRRSNLDRWSTGGGSAHRAHRAEAPHQDHHGLVGRRPSWPRDVPGERQDESALKTSSDSSLRPVGHKVKLAVGGNTTLFHSPTLAGLLTTRFHPTRVHLATNMGQRKPEQKKTINTNIFLGSEPDA